MNKTWIFYIFTTVRNLGRYVDEELTIFLNEVKSLKGFFTIFLEVCAQYCPVKYYDPLCGTDGKTYFNKCFLEKESCRFNNVRVKHKGSCGWYF